MREGNDTRAVRTARPNVTVASHPAGGIVRAPRPSGHFTQLRNEVLRDERLSFKALGVLVEILSRPDNWHTRSESLAAGRREGRDAVRSALAELRAAGYLEHHKLRGPDGRIRTVSVVYDEPKWWNPQVAPETAHPAPDEPASGKPDVGEPVAGNPGAFRTDDTNTRQEHQEEDHKEGPPPPPASSSSAKRPRRSRVTRTREEEVLARQNKIQTRKSKEHAAAVQAIARRLNTDTELAEATLDYLHDLKADAGEAIRSERKYVDGIPDDELAEHFDEATWEIRARRDQVRQLETRQLVDQIIERYPRTSSRRVEMLLSAIDGALRDGYSAKRVVDLLNETHARAAPDTVAGYLNALADLAGRAA